MNPLLFPTLGHDALLWVWISDRALSVAEKEHLLKELGTFVTSWTSHGRPVRGDTSIVSDRILLVAGEVGAGDISGCGIDKSVRIIERAADDLGFGWVSGLTVAFSRPGSSSIETATRTEFRALVQSGSLGPETVIYERSPMTVGAARENGLTRRATDTWTSRYFDAADHSA